MSLFVNKGFKYFIGYIDAKKMRPLCTFLPKMNAYTKKIGQTKYKYIYIYIHTYIYIYIYIY